MQRTKKIGFEIKALVIGCLLIIAFYNIRLNIFSPTAFSNDNFSFAFPTRVLISTSIQNAIFPLWDHWTHGGFPLSSLFTMTAFSPIVIFLSLFGVYKVQTFAFEMLVVLVIGFIGMYVWLKRYSSKLGALVMGVCYVTCGIFITQTPINFEFVASAAMFPWMAVGISSILEGKKYGVGIIPFTIWLASTEGYFGLNIVGWQFILLFCLIDWYVCKNNRFLAKDFLIKFRSILFGVILGYFIINYPYIETFVHYGMNFNFLREADFNPFAASAKLFSIFALIVPNKIDFFFGDSYQSYTLPLYFGSLNIIWIIYAILKKINIKTVITLVFLSIISFCSMLSNKYIPGRLLNSTIPFLGIVRWHGVYLTITLFFLSTLASVGFQPFIDDKKTNMKWVSVIIFALLMIFAVCKQAGAYYTNPLTYLAYPQIYVYILFVAILLLVPIYKNILYSIAIVVLLEILTVSGDIRQFGNYFYLLDMDIRERDVLNIQTKHFPPPDNIRTDEQSNINIQYYSKKPTLYGYNPITYPSIKSLYGKAEYAKLMKTVFYTVDSNSFPIIGSQLEVSMKRFTPNTVEATITAPRDNTEVVWSSPYVQNWKLYVNGKSQVFKRNMYGLISFILPEGGNSVVFRYSPRYLIPSIFLSLFALSISVYLLIPYNRKAVGKK